MKIPTLDAEIMVFFRMFLRNYKIVEQYIDTKFEASIFGES